MREWGNFIAESMQDLNELLVKRYKRNTFKEFTATNKTDALTIILTERRKELLFRGLQWMDLRRLNRDPRFAVTIKRYFEGQEYVLAPNDLKYTYPIPDDEVLQSNIEQNPRQ